MTGDQLINFGFSEMTTDRLTSDMIDPFTNSAMPSSPPTGFFAYLDPTELDDSVNAMWDHLVEVNATQPAEQSTYPDPEGLAIADTGAHALRRSPRRQKAK